MSKPTRNRAQGILPLFMRPMAVWRFLTDARAGWGAKIALLTTMAYMAWPIDLIPDLIPIIGWLDDAGLASAAVAWAAAAVQRHATAHQHALAAGEETARLEAKTTSDAQ